MEQIRITKLNRIGSSLGIVIPQEILQAQNLQRGDQVVLRCIDNNTISVRKLSNEEIKSIIKF